MIFCSCNGCWISLTAAWRFEDLCGEIANLCFREGSMQTPAIANQWSEQGPQLRITGSGRKHQFGLISFCPHQVLRWPNFGLLWSMSQHRPAEWLVLVVILARYVTLVQRRVWTEPCRRQEQSQIWIGRKKRPFLLVNRTEKGNQPRDSRTTQIRKPYVDQFHSWEYMAKSSPPSYSETLPGPFTAKVNAECSFVSAVVLVLLRLFLGDF